MGSGEALLMGPWSMACTLSGRLLDASRAGICGQQERAGSTTQAGGGLAPCRTQIVSLSALAVDSSHISSQCGKVTKSRPPASWLPSMLHEVQRIASPLRSFNLSCSTMIFY